MPRSFQFSPYSPQRLDEGRRIKTRRKKLLVESELHAPGPAGEPALHYGRKFAETERLAHEHAEHPRPPKAQARKEPPKMSVSPELPVLRSRAARGSPIGALPQTEEPFDTPEALLAGRDFRGLLDQATRSFKRISGAVRDLSSASLELVKLPAGLARLLTRRTKEA